MGADKMTPQEALEIMAYDIADMISRCDGYDGLIPDDKATQDDLITALPVLFRALGFDPFQEVTPADWIPQPGNRVVHLHYPEPRQVWIVVKVFYRAAPGADTYRVAEVHAEKTPTRQNIFRAEFLAPAPARVEPVPANKGGGKNNSAPFIAHCCNPERPGKPLGWGRLAPLGDCPRCDELRAGAAPRPAPAWTRKSNGTS
jgi:hypothetical protein